MATNVERRDSLIREWEENTGDTFSDYAYLTVDDLTYGLSREDAEELDSLIQLEVEETIADNAKIEAAFQNARTHVGGLIVPDEHDPRL